MGWCAPQQGACKLTLNVKDGIIQEALVETLGCSGMTHSAAMAAEILPGRTLLEALNTDLVCDAINTAMRELFLQIVYGRTQSAFSEDGLPIGAGLEDLGKGPVSYTHLDVYKRQMHLCWAAVIFPLTVMIRPEKLSVPLLFRKPRAFTLFSSSALTVNADINVLLCENKFNLLR